MGILSGLKRFLVGGNSTSKSQSSTTATGTTATTSTTNPYAGVIPALDKYIADIQGLYTGGAPQISGAEQQGYDKLNAVTGDTSGLDAAVAANKKVLSGDYLSPDTNPYLADIAQRVSGRAMAAINSTFGGKGRTGSGLHATFAGEGVGNALTDLYGGAYEAERGRMTTAAGMAPALEGARYLAPQAQISAGQNITARPFDLATQYGGILQNIARLGGTTTSNGTTTGQTDATGSSKGSAEKPGLLPTFVNKLFS